MIGLGVDAVDIARFRAVLARRPEMRRRLFAEEELDSLAGRADDVPSLAARFAVREATMKALGVGLGAFDFRDVWLRPAATEAAPGLCVTGRAEELARAAGVARWHVSISHTDATAIAVVAAL